MAAARRAFRPSPRPLPRLSHHPRPPRPSIPFQIFLAKHSTEQQASWVSGNSAFFRMHRVCDIYFVGGFGTVSWVDAAEYAAARPDAVATAEPLPPRPSPTSL